MSSADVLYGHPNIFTHNAVLGLAHMFSADALSNYNTFLYQLHISWHTTLLAVVMFTNGVG